MTSFRRAKIVCTLGPATFSKEAIEKLIRAGMDVARLNFSHGDYSIYKKVIRNIRVLSRKLKKQIVIMQDLQGPKLRVGELAEETVLLKSGKKITITTRPILGHEKLISVPYKPLPHFLHKGNSILIDDGLIELKVLRKKKNMIECVVVNGGVLKEHKGVNIPYVKRKESALTLKDKKDLAFGVRHGVDIVALSFIRSSNDILELKRIIPKSRKISIVAKIEKPEALDHFDKILEVSDGIMVARGDLAVESSTEVVPVLQKQIIQKCNEALKPVITATQMLESMIVAPRPTRAEASDVANAVFDGSDALMLSAETATGQHPIQAVAMMDKIIRQMEQHHGIGRGSLPPQGQTRATEKAACDIAEESGAKLICCLTEKGRSAAMLSQCRPKQPIIAFTHEPATVKKLALCWGVETFLFKNLLKSRDIFKSIAQHLLQLKMVKKGDRIVITTGVFTHSPNTTRIVKLHRI